MSKLLIIMSLAMLVTSCSVFKSSHKIDMSPFSDNAATLFSEAVKVSRPFQWKNLKSYTSVPEFQNLEKEAIPLLMALQGIVYYSNQVVAINNAKLSEKEKNKQLAYYLGEAMEKALKEQRVDSLQLDKLRAATVLDNIRKAETYLDGISAASPIVNSVVVAIQKRLDDIQDTIPFILVAFDHEIEKDFGATRTNYERLWKIQEQLMLSVTRLYRVRLGDRAELDTLLREDVSLRHYFASADQATPAQLAAAETFLVGQLNLVDILIHQLDEAKVLYNAKQDELIAWRNQTDEKIRIARTAMSIWAQSHRNLGAGIPVPPLFDVAGFATGLVGSAAKVVVP